MKKSLLIAFSLALVCVVADMSAQEKKAAPEKKTAETKMPEHQVSIPSDIQWKDAPPVLPAGAKIAVLDGDPAKAGYFAMRLKMPDGYKIMPHWHPNVERLTIISGTAHVGMGDKFDEGKGDAMPSCAPKFIIISGLPERPRFRFPRSGPGSSSTSIRPTTRARRSSSRLSAQGGRAAALPVLRLARPHACCLPPRYNRRLS